MRPPKIITISPSQSLKVPSDVVEDAARSVPLSVSRCGAPLVSYGVAKVSGLVMSECRACWLTNGRYRQDLGHEPSERHVPSARARTSRLGGEGIGRSTRAGIECRQHLRSTLENHTTTTMASAFRALRIAQRATPSSHLRQQPIRASRVSFPAVRSYATPAAREARPDKPIEAAEQGSEDISGSDPNMDPGDPSMNGNYPDPSATSALALKRQFRDPYGGPDGPWWDPQERRNYGEPVHEVCEGGHEDGGMLCYAGLTIRCKQEALPSRRRMSTSERHSSQSTRR